MHSQLPSADGDQQCHFKEKRGEVSIVLLQMGSAEKWLLATYINSYLKNQYLFNCTLNLGFFHHFGFPPDSHLFWHFFLSAVVPPYITAFTPAGFCPAAYHSENQLFCSELQQLIQETQENKNE